MAKPQPADHDAGGPSSDGFRELPTVTADGTRLAQAFPERIGRYHVKRVIATGGMGTVYEATQESPRRVVAVKVMKQGIASKSALRRFEYEAQILGRLRHPGIAQIYEAGTHHDPAAPGAAVPYFAMEYIPNAKTITKYAEEKKLGTRQRMELFAKVCDAVHHGHQKGIIHRDLKPGNILVDSHGELKVIDFGVARGTDSDLAVTMLQTDIGQLVGTLQYMSPEQCEGDPHDIDTRSDVYALGVVLYELLSGKLPYDVSRSKIFDGTRMIREQQPTKLSTVDKTLRGDVETIVFKALEKDRDRRYQSAVEFAQDIRRYLSGEAITARPPSIIYQLRVFARRNKAVFSSLAAVFIVLVAGIIVSTSLYVRAERARAEQTRERQRAEREARTAQAVTKYLSGMLASADPFHGPGPQITVRELVDQAAKEIPTVFQDRPLVEASLRSMIGRIYMLLGQLEVAEPHVKIAAALREHELPENHPDRAASLFDIAWWRWSTRTDRLDMSVEPMVRQALEIRRNALGNDDPDVADMHWLLGTMHSLRKDYATAEPMYRERVEIYTKLYGHDNRFTADALSDLANCLRKKGDYTSAELLYQEGISILQRVGAGEHCLAGCLLGNLGDLLCETGRPEEGLTTMHQGIVLIVRGCGPTWTVLAAYRSGLADCLAAMQKYRDAEQELLQAYEIRDLSSNYLATRTRGVIIEKLVTLYESWDAAEPGKGYAEKAAAWREKLEETSKSQNVETPK